MRYATRLMWFTVAATIGCTPPSRTLTSGVAPATRAASSDSVVRVTGSDTMVNLLQAWAETYKAVRPEVDVLVAGGGSGVGLASLAEGLTAIAAASREMTAAERQRITDGAAAPIEYTVALDALAVYVHRTNPIDALSLPDLAEVYGDGGAVVRWSQLGVHVDGCRSDAIIRVGRQSSSGTYVYFRDAVLGHRRDFKLGSIDQNGSKDVVALVARTPCAIGYSGLAYATPGVKALRIASAAGAVPVVPTLESALRRTYPLSRRLYLYTAAQPDPRRQAFLDWILSPAGQQVVRDVGFVPVGESGP